MPQTPPEPATMPRDPLVGAFVAGRFLVESVLARGSMGRVYRASQIPLQRPVALKVLDVQTGTAASSGEFERRFLREASTLARLTGPHVVRVYDFGRWEGFYYIAMELVDGQSLARLMRDGPMSPATVVHLSRQITSALGEAHQAGLVHRDLKPSNVLVASSPDQLVAKVVDFGLVKDLTDPTEATTTGQVLGSPMYMSPEQVRSEAVDGRADLYALGVVMYRALTGSPPWPNLAVPALLIAHLEQVPPPLRTTNPDVVLPEVLEWTVLRCLEKRPDQRFGSAAELSRALELCALALHDPTQDPGPLELVAGVLRVPGPEESLVRGGRPTRSTTRTALFGGAAALLFVLVAAAWVGWELLGATPEPVSAEALTGETHTITVEPVDPVEPAEPLSGEPASAEPASAEPASAEPLSGEPASAEPRPQETPPDRPGSTSRPRAGDPPVRVTPTPGSTEPAAAPKPAEPPREPPPSKPTSPDLLDPWQD